MRRGGIGSWVLGQPERIDAYAQAVIRTLWEDELQCGWLMEERVLKGGLAYESSMPRLAGDEERFVLLAMHQTLVERGFRSPGGRKRIAQRFIAGFPGARGISPVRDERTSSALPGVLFRPWRGFRPLRSWLPTVQTVGYFRAVPDGTRNSTNQKLMHSFVSCLMHCVWATKERRPFIKPELQTRLWAYLGGVARENKMKALVVGGVADHVHVLVSVPATLSLSKCVQLLKGNSSKWVHDTFKEHWDFEWQEGYGAFSIGISGVEDTMKYIQGQAEHHRKVSLKEELEVVLNKHGMEYVERDLE